MRSARLLLANLDAYVGYVGILLAGGATATTLSGVIVDPRKRMALTFAIAFCFGTAWWRSRQNPIRRTQILDGNEMPIAVAGRPKSVWGALCAFCLVVLTIDAFVYVYGIAKLVHVKGPSFREFESRQYVRWPFKRHLQKPRIDFDRIGAAPVTQPIPIEGINVNDRANQELSERADIDGFDVARSRNKDNADALYSQWLREHFRFSVRKTSNARRVTIADVVVTVHEFEAIPKNEDFEALHMAVRNSYLAYVELENLGTELPWTFSASLLLMDPTDESVQFWDRTQIVLDDDQELAFLVKIGAKHRGIYTYTATLYVSGELTQRKPVELISHENRRTCAFLGR